MSEESTETSRTRACVLQLLAASALFISVSHSADDPLLMKECVVGSTPEKARIVCADLVALEQTLVHSRFSSFNQYGMKFDLRRDIDLSNSLEEETVIKSTNKSTIEAEQFEIYPR